MKVVPLHPDSALPPPPTHIAIIMDGNGRWANARGLPRTAGHKRGAESVKTAVESAFESGVSYLTLYGFSSENWKRPEAEVSDLMGLLRYYLKSEINYLHDRGVRFRVIGDRQRLAPDIVSLIDEGEKKTAANAKLTLVIALSYGGRAEITQAAIRMGEEIEKGRLNPADINEDVFSRHLFTEGIPDPDLLIRTSGEQRISNFLLWQLAYAEFIFVDTLWPDFSKEHFVEAIREYHRRDRRYGATGV
ncbi:MAG: isoprenyl transferase [Rhodospirillales bacterium]|nr:isoprenyl transferase [Rhodospirillales bacterium]